MRTLIGWVLAHKRVVVVGWLLLAVAGGVRAGSLSSSLTHNFDVPGGESFQTDAQMIKTYGSGGGLSPLVPVVVLPAERR